MTSIAVALRLAQKIKTDCDRNRRNAAIKAWYKQHMDENSNPLTAPNFHQLVFLTSLNEKLTVTWRKP